MQLDGWEQKYLGIKEKLLIGAISHAEGTSCFTERRERIDCFGRLVEGKWVRRATLI